MTIGPSPMCLFCAHYDRDEPYHRRCVAYPEGIPPEIMENLVDHRQMYQGDHGVTYTPADPTADPPASFQWFDSHR